MKNVRTRSEGFTLIELLIVIAVIAILAALAIPNLLSSRKAANETAAIAHLKTIASAEETYKIRNLGATTTGGTTNEYATLALLEASKLVIWPTAGAPYVKSGYTFDDIGTPNTTNWGVSAAPNDGAGDRAFCVTMDNFVRGAASGTTFPTDPTTIDAVWTPVQ